MAYLLDVNVWVAIAYPNHQFHQQCREWFHSLGAREAYFCRITQLGMLRILTNPHSMKQDVQSQRQAWMIHDGLRMNARVGWVEEPSVAEEHLRKATQSDTPKTGAWTDAYIAAVAAGHSLTLATCDKKLAAWFGPHLLFQE